MASLWDAAPKCSQLALIQPCLFFTDSIRELIHTPGGQSSQATGTQEHVPSISYHIQVRRSSWPVFCDNSISLIVVSNYLGTVAGGFVVNHNETFQWMDFHSQKWQDDITEFCSMNGLQINLTVAGKAYPHCDGSGLLRPHNSYTVLTECLYNAHWYHFWPPFEYKHNFFSPVQKSPVK